MQSLQRITSSRARFAPRSATRPARAAMFALAAAGGLGTVLLAGPATPSALAAPDPCAASEVAKTVAMVATHTGNYLEANPTANRTLTAISKQQGGPESIVALKAYFDTNPQVAGDLQRLQQPLVALSAKCDLPITLPQVLGMMQSAQQNPAAVAAPAPAPAPQPVPVTQNAVIGTDGNR